MFILLRSLLVALNFISFIPQVGRMYRTKSTKNISFILVSFNVFSAMEQANVCKFISMKLGQPPTLHTQGSAEWMELFQVTAVWMALSTILWLITLYYYDGSPKSKMLSAFVFLLSQVQGTPFLNALPHRGTGEILTSIPHIVLFLNPAITGLAYHAFIHERILPTTQYSSSILSLVGLAGQSVIHLILALKWITEAPIPWARVMSGSVPLPSLWFFYNFFGWGFVENLVLALIHGTLFRMARKERNESPTINDQEKGGGEPLLGLA
ncbi:hypothetical protein PEBR_25752 [Penicillium brasilianum]|uniref:Uncharacterized protein n=1 Tax=Penicillium brasilianum TaxID=104259 RepID=A0A1S9RJZ4_PENBI|nr:hypothetical protein PEBR_25752 [Penicillium brasilianum]